MVVLGLMLATCLNYAQAQGPSGEDLVKRLSCQGCHAQAGQGGRQGPSLDGVGQRLSPEAIKKHLLTPQGRMPNFVHLRPEELDAVLHYLSGLK
jgi:mono/diheme cytochrome c family protein